MRQLPTVTTEGALGVGMEIVWQQGPMSEGVNGAIPELPIRAAIERLEHFQRGPARCEENRLAIESLNDAIRWLNRRIADRHTRGVIGTDKP